MNLADTGKTSRRRPPRAWLRHELADSGIIIGGRPQWALDIECYLDNTGRVLATADASLRYKEHIALREWPAQISERQNRILADLSALLVERLADRFPATIYRACFALVLGDEEVHLDAVDAYWATPAIPTAHCLDLRIDARSAGRLQDLRGLDGLTPAASWTAYCQVGDQIADGDRIGDLRVEAPDRPACIAAASEALSGLRIDGLANDRGLLLAALSDPTFLDGTFPATLLHNCRDRQPALVIETAGIQSTVQDNPGRQGYWDIGVPPSGPMDDLGLRLANRAVGNAPGTAGIEVTLGGFAATINHDCLIALGGAPCSATCNDSPIPWLEPIAVSAGSRLVLPPPPRGLRSYLAIRGGIDCASYLGSRSTFTLGGFGGHQGRELRPGDRLPIGSEAAVGEPTAIPIADRPAFPRCWEIGVRIGPHANPDFLTDDGMVEFFTSTWTVSSQSNRTGVRLNGPTPQWSRSDGGEAGLHPSNLHDNAYAFGAIDLTGDLPVILGPDGPSLGGFVCPGVVVAGQRWKLGQLRPGDTLRWTVIDGSTAAGLRAAPQREPVPCPIDSPIIIEQAAREAHPGRCIRRQGDEFMLIEFGPMELDLGLRLRIQALYERIRLEAVPGIIDLVPGIRSLQVHFDPSHLSEERLSRLLADFDDAIDCSGDIILPSRTVHLPLSWDDPATRRAIEIYMQTVNPDAPWCPWNIEFIRRINGLGSVDDVQELVFNADYLVYGLGDVYLGAPVATPWDPRHRLVTTKYNPARTWTPENAVGIGGAYMCIYGMEGPGGYQFVGRTVQVWNTHPRSPCFADQQPWLLRQFDRISYDPVSAEELLRLREAFPAGRWEPRIEEGELSLAAYRDLIDRNRESILTAQSRQQAAFAAERERWATARITKKEAAA